MTDAKFTETASRIYAPPQSLRGFNADIVAQFRANGGHIVSGPLAGAPLLLLTVAGAAGPELGRVSQVPEGGGPRVGA
jgi:hypothetical protein